MRRSVSSAGRVRRASFPAVSLGDSVVSSNVKMFGEWVSSLESFKLIGSSKTSGSKFLLSSSSGDIRVEFVDSGVLVSNGYSSVESFVATRPAAVAIRRVAQSVFGCGDDGRTVTKGRVLSTGVEFKTPNGATFIVQGSNSRITLGLYDLLYDAVSEQCVTMLPQLMGNSPDVDLVGSAVDALSPVMLSIRSSLLYRNGVTEMGGVMVTPADFHRVVSANRHFGDNSRWAGRTAAFDGQPVSAGVRIVGDDFIVTGVVRDGNVQKSVSLKCSLDKDVLQNYLAVEGATRSDLRSGVKATSEDSMRMLLGGLKGENTLMSSAGVAFSSELVSGADALSALSTLPESVRSSVRSVRRTVFKV